MAVHTIAGYAGERPNVLVIMADDLGYNDLACYGCEDIPTPHIDSLAEEGVRFTSGYVTWPMCGPSRAGFITGRYQSTFGYYRNQTTPLDPNQGLPKMDTVANLLQKQGYIDRFENLDNDAQGSLRLFLKYYSREGQRVGVIEGIRRVSRPGRRVYSRAPKLKPVLNGLGIQILSTSRGVVSDREARQRKLGGEVLCEVW